MDGLHVMCSIITIQHSSLVCLYLKLDAGTAYYILNEPASSKWLGTIMNSMLDAIYNTASCSNVGFFFQIITIGRMYFGHCPSSVPRNYKKKTFPTLEHTVYNILIPPHWNQGIEPLATVDCDWAGAESAWWGGRATSDRRSAGRHPAVGLPSRLSPAAASIR